MTTSPFDSLRAEAEAGLTTVHDLSALEAWHLRYFGRERGELTLLTREIPKQEPTRRKEFGQQVHQLRTQLEASHAERLAVLERAELEKKLASDRVDVTLPGRRLRVGTRHPVTQALEEVCDTFERLGFTLVEGPEIEDDWHNFTALNTPEHHPAREMQDTFYLPDGRLLRTHTSSVQIRVMESQRPPIRVIAPGRVYRRDAVTSRHYPIFHQIEGLVVDEHTTFAELKGTLQAAVHAWFGSQRKVRFRPSFFPFTEPSAEYDVECFACQGTGCRTCSHSGWLELGGCGMVDPAVLEAVQIDPERYTGFAFGLGADRIAMKRHAVPDIRMFWEDHARFLGQF